MATNNIKVALIGTDKSFSRTLTGASKGIYKLGNQMQAFGRAMTLGVTVPIVAGFTLATKAAIEEQKEMALLEQALKKNAKATDAQVAATEKWVTATQNATGIADGELRPALAALVRSTKDTGKAQELLGIAMDISVAKGKSLQTVADAIAKAYAGNTSALGRLGISMKDAKGEALDFEGVMKKATKTFGGAAAKAADTTAGRLAILKAKFADLAEEVGTALIPFVETAAEVIGKLATAFNGLSPSMKKAAVYAGLVAAAIGPASWLAGGGIKVVLRLAAAYKAVAKWAGLAAVAQGASGGKADGLSAAGSRGAGLINNGAAAALGSGGAGASLGATFAAVAAPIIAGAVAAAIVTKGYQAGQSLADERAAAMGRNRVLRGAGDQVKIPGTSVASNKPLIQKLTIQAQNKTGPAFRQVMQDYQTIKELSEAGIELKIDKEKPLESLQSIQARLMSTGQTAGEAVKTMERLFGKDVVAPLRKHMERVATTMNGVEGKVKASHARMAAKLMQKIRMPAPDASSLLNTLQQVYNKLVALGYSAQQAADAIARAVSASGHLKSGLGAGGHLPGDAQGGIVTSPRLSITGEDGPEAIIPLTKPRRAAEVMAEAGLLGVGAAPIVNVYLDSEPIAARVEVRRKDKARRNARTLGYAT